MPNENHIKAKTLLVVLVIVLAVSGVISIYRNVDSTRLYISGIIAPHGQDIAIVDSGINSGSGLTTVPGDSNSTSATSTSAGGMNPSEKWILSEVSPRGIQFMYPDPFPWKYVSATAWPPSVDLLGGGADFSCTAQAKSVEGQLTKFTEHRFNGQSYCVGVASEGAAGSTYKSYQILSVQGDFIAQAEFTLRFVQCANYEDPQMTACTNEQQNFDVLHLADKILQSIRMQ